MKLISTYFLITTLLASFSAIAGGDLTRRAERLQPLFIDANLGFSTKQYLLETGVYYRWRFQGDGRDEYTMTIPDLFNNTWLERIVVDDIEIPISRLVEFTLEGDSELDIYFIPVRPGSYLYYVEPLRSMGFEGEVVVQ